MRYAHPQERHQIDAVKRLEAFNAAKEIAEAEKKKRHKTHRVGNRSYNFPYTH